MTTTHTHVATSFADPYLRCDKCGQPVTGWLDPADQAATCSHGGQNVPCGHIGVTSICPSWSPVNGCQCMEHLGYQPHPLDPAERREDQ